MIIYQFENIGKAYDYKHNCHSNWYVPHHLHEFSEFVFVEKGVFYMHIDGIKYTVPENHLIFVGPNQLHDCYSEAPSIVHCIVFSNDFAPFFYSSTKDMEIANPVFDFSSNKAIIEELNSIDPSKTLKLCGLLNLILDFILERSSFVPDHKDIQNYDKFHLIIKYVSKNFKDDIHLSDMAKSLGYHEKYLSSAIRSLTGMNFRTFLAMYRIDYAKRLLLNSHFTISEIASQSGFSSLNTFNRMFITITGTTPSEFKKQLNNIAIPSVSQKA
ncbi:MAG: helix-turn-helix transcriptional regulator [Clostridia bacterium]|nr:helix-turn-helix transcriptional regulator [Clostridia bacterium]MBR2944958.1 helix-turn-helix transcriptional regulator [Clostridia bacterium]